MSLSKRRRLKPEARRNEIIEAAERLLKIGGTMVRVDEVVREAGAAKGTFYLYFPTWDDLLEALRVRGFEAFDATYPVPGSTGAGADWQKDLEGYAAAFVDAAIAMGGLHDVLFHTGFAQRRPSTHAVDRLTSVIGAGQRAGAFFPIEPEALARLLFAVMHETLDAVAEGNDRQQAIAAMNFVLRRTLAPERSGTRQGGAKP